ncbi:methyl-accepting chemotaxis protein [Thermodesulfovibrio yellowstonii]|uniref:Methyl-accepting chemotaxis protein n=1 Tax=Thermodesulfovibrio yellowstonii TaxID=28262 RepID=A0A9W6GHK3_9BACT|nr:methyl-accepting chemotaxis protein [Thermodesulfovibrio islandicus]GLI54193.1 methyl-accepting chemotaxis protein [Thermodesulfovibrio islandicus]
MFKNLTIGKKLGIGFGVVIALLIILGFFVFTQLTGIEGKLGDIDERTNKLNDAAIIRKEVKDILTTIRDMMLTDDIKRKEEMKKEIDAHRKIYKEKFEALEKVTRSEQGKKILQEIENAIKDAASANNKVIELSFAGKNKEAIAFFNKELPKKVERINKSLDAAVNFQHENLSKRVSEIKTSIRTQIVILIVISLASACIGIFFALFISRSVKKPVTELKEVLGKVAQGDLSVDIKVESKDELGMIAQSMHEAITSIKRLIAESKTISSSLASSSEELSATTEEISRNLKSQTERASQIASAAEEMSQTVVDIAKNASNIAEVSVTTASVAKEGKDMTMNTAQEIKVIEGAIGKLSEVINVLGDRSRQIGEIVTVIKDIADQTNLLALNAAIEAARAGEQGRGFAVVADEVRKLAERTTKATDEIAEMIRGIQTEVDVAEGSMEDATKKVASGVELSNKSAEILGQILGKAQELQSMIQQIASATEEMSSVTDHITQDIGSIAEGSKEISLAVDQSAQTASDIARLGGELQTAIGRFRV